MPGTRDKSQQCLTISVSSFAGCDWVSALADRRTGLPNRFPRNRLIAAPRSRHSTSSPRFLTGTRRIPAQVTPCRLLRVVFSVAGSHLVPLVPAGRPFMHPWHGQPKRISSSPKPFRKIPRLHPGNGRPAATTTNHLTLR